MSPMTQSSLDFSGAAERARAIIAARLNKRPSPSMSGQPPAHLEKAQWQ